MKNEAQHSPLFLIYLNSDFGRESSVWRGGRVAECGGLERRETLRFLLYLGVTFDESGGNSNNFLVSQLHL